MVLICRTGFVQRHGRHLGFHTGDEELGLTFANTPDGLRPVEPTWLDHDVLDAVAGAPDDAPASTPTRHQNEVPCRVVIRQVCK